MAGTLENPEDGFGLQQAMLEEVASGGRGPTALMWSSSPYVGATRPETRLPGFAAAEILFHEDGSVKGVATGDMGVARDGTRKADWQPGLELHAKYTFFAEGVRGSLSKQVIEKFGVDKNSDVQKYGTPIAA